jgi:hypothetical protein
MLQIYVPYGGVNSIFKIINIYATLVNRKIGFSAASPLGGYPGYPSAAGTAAVPFGGLGSPALLTPPPHLAGGGAVGRPGGLVGPSPLSSSQEREKREREERERRDREERDRKEREERERRERDRREREERERRERELQRSRDLEIRLGRDSTGSLVKVCRQLPVAQHGPFYKICSLQSIYIETTEIRSL